MRESGTEVLFRCGLDGTEWRASLGQVGPRLGFTAFHQPGTTVDASPASKAVELRQRLRDLSRAKPPLPPPPQGQMVTRHRAQRLTHDQITDFGFACPSCQNTGLLICPECRKFSCQAARDTADRVLCQWCGTTLVFRRAASEDAPSDRQPIDIEVTRERREVHNRELPPGTS